MENDKIAIEYVTTDKNKADILTKCLTGKPFANRLSMLGLDNIWDYIVSVTPISSSSDTPNLDISSASQYVDAHE